MFAFGLDNRSGRLDPNVLLAFFAQREAVIATFKDNPELTEEGGLYCRDEDWKAHPVLVSLYVAGLAEHGAKALEAFPAWRSRHADEMWRNSADGSQLWREAGALIDTAVYLMRLLDVYMPARNMMKRLYQSNVTFGVAGEKYYSALRGGIRAHLGRVLGKDFINPSLYVSNRSRAEQFIEDLILLIENDDEDHHVAPGQAGLDFEHQCLQALKAAGYAAEATAKTADFGADVIASKNELTFAVQCKNLNRPSGVKAVQEVVGALRHYVVDYGVVCSASGFTEAAIRLAASNQVILCDLASLPRRLDLVS